MPFFSTSKKLLSPLLALLAISAICFAHANEDAVVLQWPTENREIIRERPELFFQPTISKRLNSGMYGFVRSTHPSEPPPYFDRFHEGIDIRPLRRDSRGEPLDPVRAAAPGTVVHINPVARNSNYGLYVVMRHRTDLGHEFYTTYAHLAAVRTQRGPVAAGSPLGILGYTGAGINKERAHLHFELGFLINRRFETWFETRGKATPNDENKHGLYNGRNLLGIDPLPALKASHAGRHLALRDLLAREQPCFRVCAAAGDRPVDWLQRFPWMSSRADAPTATPPAWEITFNRIGLPLRFEPVATAPDRPTLVWFDWQRNSQDSYTRGLVQRHGSHAQLTEEGIKWVDLVLY